ncbi:MAG TPA: hypothetical protein EYP62_05935 [Kiritimatiellae bacterium]|nr:hypothetical protein [Kiritimatiellia bacterium]
MKAKPPETPPGPVEAYDFGHITIHRRTYTSDVLVFPDGQVQSNWWRLEGHRLGLEDLADLLSRRPETIVVGTGSAGCMQLDPELPRRLAEMNVKIIAEPTAVAVATFNREFRTGRTGAAFHLTC